MSMSRFSTFFIVFAVSLFASYIVSAMPMPGLCLYLGFQLLFAVYMSRSSAFSVLSAIPILCLCIVHYAYVWVFRFLYCICCRFIRFVCCIYLSTLYLFFCRQVNISFQNSSRVGYIYL